MKKFILLFLLSVSCVSNIFSTVHKEHDVMVSFQATNSYYQNLAVVTIANSSDRDVILSPHEIEGALPSFAKLRQMAIESRYEAFFHMFPIGYIFAYVAAYCLTEYASKRLETEGSILDVSAKVALTAHAGVNFGYACQTATTLLRDFNADDILDKDRCVKSGETKTFLVELESVKEGLLRHDVEVYQAGEVYRITIKNNW